MAGIYLHIPFCKQACYYCDFHFSTNQQLKEEMTSGIIKELILRNDYLGESINTIYFGGGTPSLLSIENLHGILNTIYAHYKLGSEVEITLEANPDDLSLEKLSALYALGVNRLSIGIQSFKVEELRFLNRAHSSNEAVRCLEYARSAGFKNISIDLIYGIPSQSMATWMENIQQALLLKPEHISAYALTIEDKTAFGRWQAKGKLKAAEDDNIATQLENLIDELGVAGYEQYEVSNFALPGFISKHNSNYWRREKYLGVGPSAHSFNFDSRQYNVANNHTYLREITQNRIPASIEMLSAQDKINDYLLTRLRTKWGINLDYLLTEFDYDLFKAHTLYINKLIKEEHASLSQGVLCLSRKGKLVADKIASDLFVG